MVERDAAPKPEVAGSIPAGPVSSAACVLPSPRPELRDELAERLGREGMLTVFDEYGRFIGCMGVELWKALLTMETDRG